MGIFVKFYTHGLHQVQLFVWSAKIPIFNSLNEFLLLINIIWQHFNTLYKRVSLQLQFQLILSVWNAVHRSHFTNTHTHMHKSYMILSYQFDWMNKLINLPENDYDFTIVMSRLNKELYKTIMIFKQLLHLNIWFLFEKCKHKSVFSRFLYIW